MAVISLVIEAIGVTASPFLSITTSPVAASMTSAALERSATFLAVLGSAACAKPMVSARTKTRAKMATMP